MHTQGLFFWQKIKNKRTGEIFLYYISIGGAAKQPAIDRIKRQIKTVLAVDNDSAGQICRDRNSELPFILPVTKDWNEDLQTGQYYGLGNKQLFFPSPSVFFCEGAEGDIN